MTADSDQKFAHLRRQMVAQQLRERGVVAANVLSAMQAVPRELFVPGDLRAEAYADRALPLGPSQTISQPYVVGLMLQGLLLRPADRVLEIGTGSGYQTALLAEIAAQVYTMELDYYLLDRARRLLGELGYGNIEYRNSNGFDGWPEAAPFDKIILSAAPDHVPRELVRELGERGRMILPLGDAVQELIVLHREDGAITSEEHGAVRFVAMKR